MSEPWRNFDDREALAEALAGHLADRLRTDISGRGAGSLAVSGGGTPKPMFQALARQDLPWSQVSLTLVDERWVGADHPDSNERLLREHLHTGLATEASIVGLKTQHLRASEGEGEAAARIAAMPRPFSAVVLGMGSDGHTASWFPQAANLARMLDLEGSDLVAATEPVTAPHARMTLTLPAVLNSTEVILHITGEDKKAVLGDAIARGYPVAAVLKQSSTPLSIWWAP